MDVATAVEPPLIVEEAGAVLRVTLNRPAKLNALTAGMFAALAHAVDDFARRDDLRVFLIRATGRYFCAGVDLVMSDDGSGHDGPRDGRTAAVRAYYRTRMGPGMVPLYDAIEMIEKPFVVAHQGPCVGGGLELSLSCDFRLAARSAEYRFPEAKLGAVPAAGGVSRFTRLVGPQWAKWILMADQAISAERALAIGLIQQVYDDADFDAQVMRFCQGLAAKPPEMMAMAKLTIDLAANAPPDQARRIEILGQSILHVGRESADLLDEMRSKLRRPK